MTQLLLKLFVPNFSDPEDPNVHAAVGKLAGITGIVCNVLLFLGKLTAGLLAGSIALVADAVNNLSDAASSIVTLLGFHLARRPADADHPYGHARYEYVSGMVVAALILFIGLELVKSSVGKIFAPEPITVSALTLAVPAASILVKLWMCCFFRRLGKHIQSATLLAASADSRNDVIAAAAVLAGITLSRFCALNADGYIGLAVAVFILVSGVSIAKDTISPLLGTQADRALVEKLSQLILADPNVLGIHDILVHDYGPGQCFASLHAELSALEDPMKSHDIIDNLECEALQQLNIHLVIHFDPILPNDPAWESMRTMAETAAAAVDPRLSIHDFRVVSHSRRPRLVFDLAVPYDLELTETDIRDRIANVLRVSGIEYPVVIRFDRKA